MCILWKDEQNMFRAVYPWQPQTESGKQKLIKARSTEFINTKNLVQVMKKLLVK